MVFVLDLGKYMIKIDKCKNLQNINKLERVLVHKVGKNKRLSIESEVITEFIFRVSKLKCIFRLSHAYKSMEEQEIQASIPNIKPSRRPRIRMPTVTPQRMNNIAERHETDNNRSSDHSVNESVNQSMKSPRTASRAASLNKLRNAVKKAAMLKAWSRGQNSDRKDGEETQAVNQPVVRFKSEEDSPQPVNSKTPTTSRKLLVNGDSANKRDKETARLISAINREKAKAAIQNKAKYNKERESKKLKEKEPCDKKRC